MLLILLPIRRLCFVPSTAARQAKKGFNCLFLILSVYFHLYFLHFSVVCLQPGKGCASLGICCRYRNFLILSFKTFSSQYNKSDLIGLFCLQPGNGYANLGFHCLYGNYTYENVSGGPPAALLGMGKFPRCVAGFLCACTASHPFKHPDRCTPHIHADAPHWHSRKCPSADSIADLS